MRELVTDDDATVVERLREIWCEALPASEIGLDDALPDLATQSMTIVRLAVLIKESLDVDLPLEVFLQAPTLRGVAGAVSALRAGRT